MHTAATTSQAALTASPRLRATMANEMAPRSAMPTHKILVCQAAVRPFRVVSIVYSRNAAKPQANAVSVNTDRLFSKRHTLPNVPTTASANARRQENRQTEARENGSGSPGG